MKHGCVYLWNCFNHFNFQQMQYYVKTNVGRSNDEWRKNSIRIQFNLMSTFFCDHFCILNRVFIMQSIFTGCTFISIGPVLRLNHVKSSRWRMALAMPSVYSDIECERVKKLFMFFFSLLYREQYFPKPYIYIYVM